MQTPAWQVLLPTQTLPQEPQLVLSVWRLMHVVPVAGQVWVPVLHTHLPCEHVLSALQTTPQAPQLSLELGLTQVPLHSIS